MISELLIVNRWDHSVEMLQSAYVHFYEKGGNNLIDFIDELYNPWIRIKGCIKYNLIFLSTSAFINVNSVFYYWNITTKNYPPL